MAGNPRRGRTHCVWIERPVESEDADESASKKKWRLRLTGLKNCAQGSHGDILTFDSEKSSDNLVMQSVGSNQGTLKITDLYLPPVPRNVLDKLTTILGETYRFQSQRPTTNGVDHDNAKIHGVSQLAPGYALSYIPEDMKVYPRVKHQRAFSECITPLTSSWLPPAMYHAFSPL
ncbi:MAG: hypothetical protein Q9196_005869 [Gyalolechia fulgens]